MKRVLVAIGVLAAFGARPICGPECRRMRPLGVERVRRRSIPASIADNRALFRVAAPDAQKVRVRVGPGFDMTKGPDGIWSVTTTPLVVGFHYYTLQIDGATVADPSTHTYFGSGWQNSAIEVPAADAAFYSTRMSPTAAWSARWYTSKVTGKWRRAFVYTPPDYDSAAKKSYPCSISCTGGVETKPAGTGRGTWTPSSTT